MKVYEVYSFEDYGDLYPIKIFKSKSKAIKFMDKLENSLDEEENGYTFYGVRELSADLDD